MRISYRPEIDGLRALAVLAVIIYHAKITIFNDEIFTGGFIGVDIFFVISGYLITSIILRELDTSGSFSFKYFYERRIRRILPVLILVMLVSLPFAWMYLLPSSFVGFSKSIIYSLGFSSNFYFDFSAQLYQAENSLRIPFLHTWSLSVEEQYYLLFPITFYFVIKYLKNKVLIILIFGFLLSLIAAHWGSQNRPFFTFYSLPTRGWELIAGSILAYLEVKQGHRSKNYELNLILPSVGLLLIIHSILYFDDQMFHPSLYTLSPIIGVCLLIWFSDKREFITKILSSKLFVSIGLISYSLYLWHYPIFAFDRIIEFSHDSTLKKIFLGSLIIILSIISYFLVERPARNKKYNFKIILIIISLFYIFLILFNSLGIYKNGYKNRFKDNLITNILEKPWLLLRNSNGELCHDLGCEFNIQSKNKVIIYGDSVQGSLIFDLKNRLDKKNFRFVTRTYGGCLYLVGFNKTHLKTKIIDKNCNNDKFIQLKEILSKENDSIIIFGGRFPVHLNNSFFDNQEGGIESYTSMSELETRYISNGKYDTIQDSFRNEVSELSKKNKIILIYPIPEVGWDPLMKMWIERKNKFSKDFDLIDVSTSYEVYKDRTKSTFELFDSINNENIFRVYPHELFCDTFIKDRCVTHNKKVIFYSDSSHPSTLGAEMINELIINEIESIELKSR